MFKGCITALVTPFKNGKIDYKALEKLFAYQINGGVDGIVLCGSTGEAATLTVDEKEDFIRTSLSIIKKRVPVIIGTTSNSTQAAIEYIQQAERLGGDGALIATPYYNKPTQEGIYRHFEAIRKHSKLPIILYNIPGRSAVNMTDQTIARIAKLKNVVGMKDSSCDLARPFSLQTYDLNDKFAMLSGEDITTVAFNASGGEGLISVSANVLPKQCSNVQALCAKGDYKTALREHQKLVPLHLGLFCETNPIPVKYALHLLGLISPEMRLPLVELQEESKTKIKSILKSLKLI
jgi:4-hydroxy-tetrahydrodipicolinate synthase